MAVSGIASSPTNTYQNPANDFRQTFMQMVKSIKSGDLSDAQQAYSDLSQMQSNGQGPAANTPFGHALTQIGQALQSGDIGSAQQALTALGQQMHGAHHHHHHRSTSSDDATSAPPSNNASGTGNTIDLTA